MISRTARGVSSDWIWPHDQYDPLLSKKTQRFRNILSFEPPRHSRLVWRTAHWANRVFYLRLGGLRHGAIIPKLSQGDLAKLRAIPQGCGNILVGSHPGPPDPHLMFHLLATAHKGPAVFLMAAEAYYGGTPLRRAVLNRLGVIPVARGRQNPEAIRRMSELIASGWWGGVFPEGEVYFSRQVMPMEYGTARIAVDAALAIQRKAKEQEQRGVVPRPVFLTPFAHAYFFNDRTETMRRAESALRELESHPMVSIERPSGDLPARLRQVADRLLENKASEYRIPRGEWYHGDRFERTRKLQDAVLKRLENEYIGHVETGFARRRAMKVRMACFERLTDSRLGLEARREIEQDVQKTRELILMAPFSRAYRERYGDLEMWVEYLRRFRSALCMPVFNFGSQAVIFKILEPINMHPFATEYCSLDSDELQRAYLYKKTEFLRRIVQAGVDEICNAHQTSRPVAIDPDRV